MAAPPALPDFWRAAEVAAWQQTTQSAPAQQQQQAQVGGRSGAGGPLGKPPIPPGGRSGQGGTKAKRRQEQQRQRSPAEAEDQPDARRQQSASPGPLPPPAPAPGAASNLLGTSVAAAAGKLPPQLAGYYRWPGASLLGCLNRFTKVEELGQGETRVCGRCGCRPPAVLCVRHAPPPPPQDVRESPVRGCVLPEHVSLQGATGGQAAPPPLAQVPAVAPPLSAAAAAEPPPSSSACAACRRCWSSTPSALSMRVGPQGGPCPALLCVVWCAAGKRVCLCVESVFFVLCG
jgi:hypothetical protein